MKGYRLQACVVIVLTPITMHTRFQWAVITKKDAPHNSLCQIQTQDFILRFNRSLSLSRVTMEIDSNKQTTSWNSSSTKTQRAGRTKTHTQIRCWANELHQLKSVLNSELLLWWTKARLPVYFKDVGVTYFSHCIYQSHTNCIRKPL